MLVSDVMVCTTFQTIFALAFQFKLRLLVFHLVNLLYKAGPFFEKCTSDMCKISIIVTCVMHKYSLLFHLKH